MLQIIFCQGKILIGKVSGHFPYSLKRNVRTKGQNAQGFVRSPAVISNTGGPIHTLRKSHTVEGLDKPSLKVL